MTKKPNNKKKAEKNNSPVEVIKVHKIKTVSLTLTLTELLHIRDLMSVKASPLQSESISQLLSFACDNGMAEKNLFEKIFEACLECGIPVAEEAPTFAAVMIELPKIGIALMNEDEEIEEVDVDNDGDESDNKSTQIGEISDSDKKPT